MRCRGCSFGLGNKLASCFRCEGAPSASQAAVTDAFGRCPPVAGNEGGDGGGMGSSGLDTGTQSGKQS